jgi:fluoroquinolone transport system permease protein
MSLRLFLIGMRQIIRDGMLLVLIPAPFLMGAALRLLLPLADSILVRETGFTITPWYSLSDGLVLTVGPAMTTMISAFLILDERDEGTGAYYSITPAAGTAYLAARLGYPLIWAVISSVLVIRIFGLAIDNIGVLLAAVLVGTLLGLIGCMLVVVFAGNKVEGLALSKLTNLLMMGLPAAWFIAAPYKYILGFLPSFWLGEIILARPEAFLPCGLAGIVVSLVWLAVLLRLFLRRVYL